MSTGEMMPEDRFTKKVHDLASLLILIGRSHNERISEKTAQIVVRILSNNPKWSSTIHDEIHENDKQIFLKECYDFLYNDKSISSTTLKMQCFFYERYLRREQFVELQRQTRHKKSHRLVSRVQREWHNHTEDFRGLRDDLVRVVLIVEGMDDPDDSAAFDEIRTAVISLLSESSLSSFVLSNQKTKMAFIAELASAAAGMRLHAWYGRQAGKFMFDVGKIMKEILPKISDDFHEELGKVKQKVDELQEELKDIEGTIGNDDKLFQRLRLINLTNYYHFIKLLKESVDDVAAETYRLDYIFATLTQQLDSGLRIARADRVHPLYKELSKTWKSMQVEGHLLNLYTNLYHELRQYSKQTNESETKPNFEVPDVSQEVHTSEDDTPVVRIHEGEVKNYGDITLEYDRFCAFHCSKGVVLPLKREAGILMFGDRCYGFSDADARDKFAARPARCVADAEGYMHHLPELVITLRKEECFGFPVMNNLKKKRIHPIFVRSSGVQTDLHPSENKMDSTYNWNQWSLRREALKYVTLLGRKTHSTQTALSHFRREGHSQVYLPKDNSTQTRKETGTTIGKFDGPDSHVEQRK